MAAQPTAAERAAVDEILGPAGPGNGRVVEGGFREAVRRRTLLLPILLEVQAAIGWISPGTTAYVSQRLGVAPADVFGVATFYALLATEERPRRVAHVCDDVVCARRGASDVIDELEAHTPEGVARGDVLWLRAPCLGRCDQAPAALIQEVGAGETAHGVVTSPLVIGSTTAVPPPAVAARRAGTPGRLERVVEMGAEAFLAELDLAGLKGRGGAAFPTSAKWRAVAGAGGERYVVGNADESEPGTFKDRVLLESDPGGFVEAMTVAGFVTGASRGFIYLRGEYPDLVEPLERALDAARRSGRLGGDVLGTGWSYDVELRRGAGAYICGEETALFASIEGFRGEPRQKPPYPTESGLFGRPTAVNNVETLFAVLDIVDAGGEAYGRLGTAGSRGRKLFAVSGDVARPGVVTAEFGATLREVVDTAGGPVGRVGAVLLGGAAGAFVGPDDLDLPLTFEATRAAGLSLGSGAVVVFSDDTDFRAITERIARFFRDESCGQCVPCRIGTVRQEEALVRLNSGSPLGSTGDDLARLEDLERVMRDASICGLGQTAGSAIQSAIRLGLIGAAP